MSVREWIWLVVACASFQRHQEQTTARFTGKNCHDGLRWETKKALLVMTSLNSPWMGPHSLLKRSSRPNSVIDSVQFYNFAILLSQNCPAFINKASWTNARTSVCAGILKFWRSLQDLFSECLQGIIVFRFDRESAWTRFFFSWEDRGLYTLASKILSHMCHECCLEEFSTPQLLRVSGLGSQNFFVACAIPEVLLLFDHGVARKLWD